jgi:hypothetical protein
LSAKAPLAPQAGQLSFFLTYSPDLQVAGLYNIAAISKESAMKALATMTFGIFVVAPGK